VSGLPGPFSFLRPLGVAGGTAIGFAVGHGVSPAIRPVIQDLANQAWELHQVRPLEASIAAQLVAEELWTPSQGEAEAARTGINPERFAGLIAEARRGPTIEQAYDGVRRGVLTGATFERAMRQAGVRPEWDELMRALIEVQPSVTDLVRMSVREVFDPGARAALDLDAEFPPAFAARAEKIGVNRELAGDYWAAHWNLPSYEQGVEMHFRGEISAPELEGLLKAQDYAPTWRAKLLAIARRIPPISDMIRFAVREVYDPQARQRLGLDGDYPPAFTPEAALHGMDEERARQYWAAHWRLPSAQQGYRMLWRGEISETELDELLKALDYPPLWRSRLANIARVVPGRVDIRRMFREDLIDEPQTVAAYERLGYAPADARTLTDFAIAEKQHAATRGALVPLYRRAVVASAHAEFLEFSIDGARARAELAAVGVPGSDVDAIVALWIRERAVRRTRLTAPQVKAVWKKGNMTEAEALDYLDALGYEPEDARDFLNS